MRRALANSREAPISIYEAHLGSWRHRDGRSLTYREAALELVDYVHDMGFTHLELMPLAEYPFGGSWGYQPTGMYAPTSRPGSADDFRANLIDAAHQKGLGRGRMDQFRRIFPADAHGLATFDGTHLYEHADPREGFHPDWNTLIYNVGRNEVRNYLTANAVYWLSEYRPRRAACRCGWPRCCIATIRAVANGCSTRTADARTTNPSPSCKR